MKLIPQEVIDKAIEEYSNEIQSYSGNAAFEAGVQFAEKEVLKHIEDIIIENQGLKLFKDNYHTKFPNGITSYLETFYEVVNTFISCWNNDNLCYDSKILNLLSDINGIGGLYEYAEDLTDKFELFNKGREWDGTFSDELDKFLTTHLYETT